jgi:hypothetical protein
VSAKQERVASLKRSIGSPVQLSRSTAVVVATIVAMFAGIIAATAVQGALQGELRPDVDQIWFAARVLVEGRNPYDLIGPGREFNYRWNLFYPLPAVLPFTLLASFPVLVSRVVMSSLGCGLLAYGIARTDARGLVVFFSRAFYVNAWYAQWTPVLVATWYFPELAAFISAKPSIGVAMLPGVRDWRRARRGLLIAAALTAVAFLVQPTWLVDWKAAVDTNSHLRPWITVPGGALLLLALFRWRRWEAQLLVAFAIIPQTFHPLATLPLVLLPGSLLGKATIAALTYLPNWVLVKEPFGSRLAAATPEDLFAMYGMIVLWTVLIPTLVFVLQLRNEGPVPTLVERLASRLVALIRGHAS